MENQAFLLHENHNKKNVVDLTAKLFEPHNKSIVGNSYYLCKRNEQTGGNNTSIVNDVGDIDSERIRNPGNSIRNLFNAFMEFVD